MTVEFWFDFASTYSYPAAMRIEDLAARTGIRLRYRAFLLGPIFAAQGMNDSPFNLQPAKGRYMWRDLERLCAKYELPFRRPSVFPRNSVVAGRVAAAFADAAWLPAFVRATYVANFGEDRDIADSETVIELLASIGQAAGVLEQACSPERKSRLRENTDEAQQRGIFGAPTVFAGDEMFWGNDRLEDALLLATGTLRAT